MTLQKRMRSMWRTVAKLGLFTLLVTGCAISKTGSPARIGLLAPFEGRYREVGYNALYAARMAIRDSGREDVTLLAVDDGGSIETAVQRAHALADDDLVKVVIVLGYDAANPAVQEAFANVPVLIVGDWNGIPATETTFVLSNPTISNQLTVENGISVTQAARLEPPVVGGEVFALSGYRQIHNNLDGVTIVSSSSLPDDDFRERYLASDLFVDDPGLLATLTYDAAGLASEYIQNVKTTRSEVANSLNTLTYEGINGPISFEAGYWVQAPLNRFIYTSSGQLIQADNIIEER